MTTKKSVILSFLAGVTITVIASVCVALWVYKEIQARLSPPAIRQTAETNLTDAVSHPVSVGEASIGFVDNSLTLGEIQVSVRDDAMLVIEQVEARAESLQGLQRREIVELVVTQPRLHLKRDFEGWNLEAFLDPILGKLGNREIEDGTPESEATPSPPIAHILVTDAEVTVSLDGGAAYSGVSIGKIDLSRDTPSSPWNVRIEDSKVRLNPSEEEWPFLELVDLLKGMVSPKEDKPSDAVTDATGTSPLERFGTIALENVGFELIHPQHEIALGSFSFEASHLFEIIQARTGTLEKKSPPPAS